MTRILRWTASAALLAGSLTPVAAQRAAPLPVGVNEVGALTHLPQEGITLFGDEPMHIAPPFADWFGIHFDGPLGPTEMVGSGTTPDWAGRLPVRVKDHAADGRAAVAVTMAGPLEVRHEYWSPQGSDTFILTVILKNRGAEPLRNITYTREWMGADSSGFRHPRAISGLRETPQNLAGLTWNVKDLSWKMSAGRTFVFGVGAQPPAQSGGPPPLDVMLALWTNQDWPQGLDMGATNGVSFADYDADGWVDLYTNEAGLFWRNVNGQTWQLGADLNALMGPALIRYGSSIADYDNDGLPDIATEPRNVGVGLDRCLHLLKNLGGGAFQDLAGDPTIVAAGTCNLDTETFAWGDVDGDGHLDLLVPIYPAWAVFPGPGNMFLHAEGTNAAGFSKLVDRTVSSGLGNPVNTSRPEGAQMCDYDGDGDLDIFSNGTLYQNISTLKNPVFLDLSDTAGVQFRDWLDEGVLFADFDLDGDQDLFVSYLDSAVGNRIYGNKGDGSFELLPEDTIVNWFTGLGLGLSAADWDNDGDIDLTTRSVFRRNMFVETGTAEYVPAFHDMDLSHLTSATPAWADWDKDGDLDSAIGNWVDIGHFYDNELYDGTTPAADKRHVRVRALRDSASVPGGLETEYGALVEIRVAGEESTTLRRRSFLASGHGYLNQSEYTAHFALPEDPTPGDPGSDVEFEVVVDFPSLPQQGLWRIDGRVNPALADIDLATLTDREITVFRSGKVIVDGVTTEPLPNAWPQLTTTNGGLDLPAPGVPLPAPTASPQSGWWIGVQLRTKPNSPGITLRELVIDGQLDTNLANCGGVDFNVGVWDISSLSPTLINTSRIDAVTSPDNDRTFIPIDVRLQPNKRYRIIAKVTEFRDQPLVDDGGSGPLLLAGGFAYQDSTPCSGVEVLSAPTNGASVPMALRWARTTPTAWEDVGFALDGTFGPPTLTGTGSLSPSTPLELSIDNGLPSASTILFVGLSEINAAAYGGVLVPSPDILFVGLPLDGTGHFSLPAVWPPGVPSGFQVSLQAWFSDPGGAFGFAATNGLRGTTP